MEGIELPFLKLRPMLAVSSPPFDSPRFISEVKWDGYRALAFLDGKTRLQSRNLMDITPLFPEMGRLHLQVEGQPAVLDGERVAVDREGKPSFSLLQTQGGLRAPRPDAPLLFVAFDILYHKGQDIMAWPLRERKRLLQEAVTPGERLLLSEFIEGEGKAFWEACRVQGLEGIMAKAKESPYLPGVRSRHWRKIRAFYQGEFFIVGYEPGRGRRLLGSLILAEKVGERWEYRGKVGTGFTLTEERRLLECLRPLETPSSPFLGEKIEDLRDPRWVKPLLSCRVDYREKTPEGRLRHPVYRGLIS